MAVAAETVLDNYRLTLSVSPFKIEQDGVQCFSLSLPCFTGKHGVEKKVIPNMSAEKELGIQPSVVKS
jgi:hypothetical protein